MTIANVLGGIIFGGVGLVAFTYGRKMANFKMLGIGIALMGYPYFISNTLLLYVIGCVLTGALYFFRD